MYSLTDRCGLVNSLKVADIMGVSRSNIPAYDTQTCSHGKQVHMNKNNADGTGSPSNKITRISCTYYAMTPLSVVKHDN